MQTQQRWKKLVIIGNIVGTRNKEKYGNYLSSGHQCFGIYSLKGVELAYCQQQHKGDEMAYAFSFIFLVVKGY